MAGSSGLPFARAARRAGIDQPPPAGAAGASSTCASGCAGPTDEATEKVLPRSREAFTGVPAADDRADGAGGAGGDPAADLPADARRGLRPSGRGAARPSSSAPRATASSSCWPACSAWTAASAPATRSTRTARFTGSSAGPFMYGEGKVEAMREFAAEHDIDLDAVLRLLGLASPTCRCCGGGQPGGGQPRRRSSPRSPARRAGG